MMSPTPEQAAEVLRASTATREHLAAQGRWPRRHLLVHAVAAVLVFAALGLGGETGIALGLTGWLLLIAVTTIRSARQSVTERGGKARIRMGFLAWGVLYVAGLTIGDAQFPNNPWFWLPAALIVGSPLALAAWRHPQDHT
jgi:hypothetical protein